MTVERSNAEMLSRQPSGGDWRPAAGAAYKSTIPAAATRGGSQVIWQRRRHQGHLLTAAHRDVMLNRVSKPPCNLLKISTKCMFFGLVGISIEFSTRYRSSFSQERSSFREIAG